MAFGRRVRAVLAVLAAASLGVPATAIATVLDGPAGLVGSVALAPNGTLAAGTVCCGGRGTVAVRAPGAKWVSSTSLGSMFDAPAVAIDGRGRVLAVGWRDRGARRTLVRRERDAAGRWSPAVAITTVRGFPGEPAVEVDGAGRAIVTWRVEDRQYAVVRHMAGHWGDPLALGPAAAEPAHRENRGYAAETALAGDGTGWVAWEGADARISVARHVDGARRFGRPRSIGVRGSHRPVLAARGDGGAVVAWVGPPTIDDLFDSDRLVEAAPVFASVVSPSGVPGRPARLSNRRTGASEPFVVSSLAGDATVVWQPDEGNSARYATAGPDGRFRRARMLPGVRVDFGFAGLTPLAMRADGTALLLARGPRGTTVYGRRPATGFGELFRPPPRDDVYASAEGEGLAVAGQRLLAVWQKPSDPDTIDPSGEALLVVTP